MPEAGAPHKFQYDSISFFLLYNISVAKHKCASVYFTFWKYSSQINFCFVRMLVLFAETFTSPLICESYLLISSFTLYNFLSFYN